MRQRNVIVAGVLVAAVVAAGLLGGRHGSTHGSRPGSGPRVQFGPRVGTAPGGMEYTNGWVFRQGVATVAVYAGSQARGGDNGLLVIVHIDGDAQATETPLVLKHTGSITLLRPATVKNVLAAEQATLRFVTASGATGTLDLRDDDRVSLAK